MANLIEGIQEELNRCRELLTEYKKIPAGQFGAHFIAIEIKKGEAAISSGDVIEIMRCYENLKLCN